MRLQYTKRDGTQMEFELGERPITIGRSPEADVVVLDEKSSRIHCGIRLWDGEFYIKDLKSRNGTYVNGQRIDVAKLKAGDQIRLGSTVFAFGTEGEGRADVALQEMQEEMAQGKGYNTILKEIVGNMDQATSEAEATAHGGPEDEAEPIRIKTKKPKE